MTKHTVACDEHAEGTLECGGLRTGGFSPWPIRLRSPSSAEMPVRTAPTMDTRQRRRTWKTRLTIAFEGGQVYLVGRPGVDQRNSGRQDARFYDVVDVQIVLAEFDGRQTRV